ncbi:MAG: hypothetical protein ACOC1F_07970 [Myxococcota bacterium]
MLPSAPKPLACAAALFALCCAAGSAAAYEPEAVPVPIRDAPDDLSGHFILSPRLAYLVPMGSAEERFGQRDYISSGPAFGADLAYGVSRYVALQARFDYATFGSGGDCPANGTCEATTMAFGLGADYHLVNGAAFDPWMRAGIGYRIMRYDLRWTGYDAELEYSGFDWLHLAVGGDWYPHSMIGFGPYMALDVGSYGSLPDEPAPRTSGEADSAVHTFVSVGLRGVFDPMR